MRTPTATDAWVIPVYAALAACLTGVYLGFLAFRLFIDHEVLCVAVFGGVGGRRCPTAPQPLPACLVGGGAGAVLGLVAGLLSSRRHRR